jgi:hypothetical protein
MKTEDKSCHLPDFLLIYLQIGSAYKILDVRTPRYMTENLFKRFWNYPFLSRISPTAYKRRIKIRKFIVKMFRHI